MASYSEVMWTEQEYGAEDAAYYRLLEARNYLTEDSSRSLDTHVYREAIEQYDRHLYEKGLVSTHDPGGIGRQLFWQAITPLFKIMPIKP